MVEQTNLSNEGSRLLRDARLSVNDDVIGALQDSVHKVQIHLQRWGGGGSFTSLAAHTVDSDRGTQRNTVEAARSHCDKQWMKPSQSRGTIVSRLLQQTWHWSPVTQGVC